MKNFLFILFFLIAQFGLAQSELKTIDSLKKELKKTPSETSRVKLQNKLFEAYIDFGKTDSIFPYLKKNYLLAKKNDLGLEISNAELLIAYCFDNQSNYDSAIVYYEKALAGFRLLNDEGRVADVIKSLATAYLYAANYEKSIELYTQAFQQYQKNKD